MKKIDFLYPKSLKILVRIRIQIRIKMSRIPITDWKDSVQDKFTFFWRIIEHKVGSTKWTVFFTLNWDSANPSPAGECVPPLWFQGGALTCGRGGGGPNLDEGTDTVVL
jgi:hypothetical protein